MSCQWEMLADGHIAMSRYINNIKSGSHEVKLRAEDAYYGQVCNSSKSSIYLQAYILHASEG